MGTIVKRAKIHGPNLKEAYKRLQEADREEFGNDIYSGGWNNCVDVELTTASVFDKIALNENISKHEGAIAKCIRKPVKNNLKIKTQVENFPTKGTRKWVTMYNAYNRDGRKVVSEKTQAAAIKKAREYVEHNPNERLYVSIGKELEGGSTTVALVTYKKSEKERDGVWEIIGAMSY